MARDLALATASILLALTTVVGAQDVPFRPVRSGSFAGAGTPAGGVAIRSKEQLAQRGLGHLLSPGEEVDFSRNTLIAFVLPDQANGGTTIHLESLVRTAEAGEAALVAVVRVRHAGLGASPAVVARPFALYRTPKTMLPVRFVIAGAAPSLAPATFQVVASGSQAGKQHPAGNHVFRSEAELNASGLSSLVPNSAQIRWGQEMIAILLLGTKSRAGYSVVVKGVERQTSPSGALRQIIQFEVQSPAPGLLTGAVVESPFLVVRLPRSPHADFARIARRITGRVRIRRGIGRMALVMLEIDGRRFHLRPRRNTTALIPLDGHTVTLDGELHPTLPRLIQIRGLIAPQPLQLSLLQVRTHENSPQGLRLVGALGRVLREEARGLLVSDAQGFRWPDGRFLVTEFSARTNANVSLRLNGEEVNRLRAGDQVSVVASHESLGLRVRPKQGDSGYLNSSQLELGQAPFGILPPASPSTGLTGAIGD